MQQSFYSARSGLLTQQFGVDTWASNIANINTTGYKSVNPEFKSLFSSYLSTTNSNASTVSNASYGTTVASSKVDFSEGTPKSTKNPYDLAILKNGFFVLKDNKGVSYSRNGSFHLDANGFLVNNEGKIVQGVDLGKVKENIFISSKESNKDLNIQNSKDFQPLKIPKFAEIKAQKTTKLDMAISLNNAKNLYLLEDAYKYILSRYPNGKKTIETEDLNVFYDIKKGDKLSIQAGDNKVVVYEFGKDFNNIKQLQEKIKTSDIGISLESTSGRLQFQNASGGKQNVDFSGTTKTFLDSLGLAEKTHIEPKSHIATNRLNAREMLDINFNAISSDSGNEVGLTQGDSITAVIDGEEKTIYYGKANEVVVDGDVKGEDDTFITIGDFVKKFRAKTGLNTAVIDNKLYLRTKDDPDVEIKTNNHQLFATLGINTKIKKNSPLVSKPLRIATYAHSSVVYNANGEKFHIKTHYVLQNKKNDFTKQTEQWNTSTFVLDHNGKAINFKLQDALLSFDINNAKPNLYTKTEDGKLEKIDNLDVVLEEQHIKYNFANSSKLSHSVSNESGDSRIVSKNTDGSGFGKLDGVLVDGQGYVRLSFSNKHYEIMGRIGIVDFNNPQGLESVGGGNYLESYSRSKGNTHYKASGEPVVLWNKQGLLNTALSSKTLETSNVDLTVALTELIALQRAYGASSKAVTTSDELEQGAINLKK